LPDCIRSTHLVNSRNPITPEHNSATTKKATHIAAGNAPNPFRRNMPTTHASNAKKQHTSKRVKQNSMASSRRMSTQQLCA